MGDDTSMTPMRVAVLMGGQSSEHEISLKSGAQVMKAIADQHPLPVIIGKDGTWTIGGQRTGSLGAALDLLLARADVAFLALHGAFGEDGRIQGLLDCAGLAYVGSGVSGSALAMDKVRTKLVYAAAGIPTAPHIAVNRSRWKTDRLDLLERIVETLSLPCVLKPSEAGSSVGIWFPASRSELESKVNALLLDSEWVLAERYIKGRELTCGILTIDGVTRALPVTEIIPGAKYSYFDYEAKYTPGASQEITPAKIPSGLSDRVQQFALLAHEWLGLRDFSRTDVMVDQEGNPFLLETNTIPGLTETSLLPQAAQVAGYNFRELIQILLNNASARSKTAPV